VKETSIRRARFVQVVNQAKKAFPLEGFELRLDVRPTGLPFRDLGRRHGYEMLEEENWCVQRSNVPLQPRRLMIGPAAVGCKRMLGRLFGSRQRSGESERIIRPAVSWLRR
jgi:hypothetical protein